MSKVEKKIESKKLEPKSIFREYFESLVTTLVMAIFGMTFVVQAVTVPTGSMQNTILIDDFFLVNKFIFPPENNPLPFMPQRNIERGDIIVFKYPGFRDGRRVVDEQAPPYISNYIKRVIGLPGETVEFKDNQVFIDGQLLPEHRLVTEDKGYEAEMKTTEVAPKQPNESYSVVYSKESMEAVKNGIDVVSRGMKFGVKGGQMVVPENQYLVMGDNRDNSTDGRFWGFVPRELVIGRALFTYFSCDRELGEGSRGGCFANIRFNRIGKVIQ
jgi:signal peptidase I